jgi:spermidine/putrescine transport system ATP-binding protein
MIEVRCVTRRFGSFTALDNVSLTVSAGEFFSLLGPSGCGKTTLLRMLAGFDRPSEGTVAIAGQDMAEVPANRRPTNMVFQSYAIFPHLTVAENVGYGLRRLNLDCAAFDRRVGDALAMVALSGLDARRPNELSGGQRQRVALTRALVMRPKVLLLDEPLSALDKKLREHMHVELRQLQRAVGITFILVTHDQEEALTVSDRLAVMFAGRIAQVGRPGDLPGARHAGCGRLHRRHELPARRCHRRGVGPPHARRCGLGSGDDRPPQLNGNRELAIGIRPERMTLLVDAGASAARVTPVRITNAAYYGDMTYYHVELPGLTEAGLNRSGCRLDAQRCRPAHLAGRRDGGGWLGSRVAGGADLAAPFFLAAHAVGCGSSLRLRARALPASTSFCRLAALRLSISASSAGNSLAAEAR